MMIHPSLGSLADLTSFLQTVVDLDLQNFLSTQPDLKMSSKTLKEGLSKMSDFYSSVLLKLYDVHVWVNMHADRIRLHSLVRTLP